MPRRARQLEMRFRTWGGRRNGAGRKRTGRRRVSHRRRQPLASRYPVHVTMKVRPELRRLRTKQRVQVIRRALGHACAGDGFRIVDWSIQRDHLHLIVEAQSNARLARGIQGFSVRVARGLNRLRGARGAVFADRYHMHVLRTPRETRSALLYVLNNARRHARQRGERLCSGWLDPYSSAGAFDGWADALEAARARATASGPPPRAAPHTWLLRVGWRQGGLLQVDAVPGGEPFR